MLRTGHSLIIGSFLLLLLAGAAARSATAQEPPPPDDVAQQSVKFARVYGAVEQNYMDAIDPDRLILEGGVRGMLSSLDPFSSFFDQDQYHQLQEETRGETLGFGSILYVQQGRVMVIQAQQGSPSWRAGLGPGDQILAVNGIQLNTLSFQQLVQLLTKSRSHDVHLGVLRPGSASPVTFHLQPAEVALPTVDIAFRYSSGLGYIHVASFESKTPQEVVDALKKLDYENLKGLILDLRNNPGGMLASAVELCSLFVKPGTVVLTLRGRTVPEKTFATVPAPIEVNLPMIVLVNGNTASAAEVVTAALQDHDRALVVGEPTFGKGVVESVMPLSDETAVALLTSEYFTPSGRSIQKPLPGTALENPIRGIQSAGSSETGGKFHTADGRPVSADGGITPDVLALAPKLDPWMEFLNQAGLFSNFASEYVSYHPKISKGFEPGSETLEEFRNFLTAKRVKTPDEYWSRDQALLKTNIKVALFNLVFGLDYGNQALTLDDPQVQKAAALFPEIPKLLLGPAGGALAERHGSP
ncbi:MAG: S41 family peptidase [Candidatus Acidiferrales bacterium]